MTTIGPQAYASNSATAYVRAVTPPQPDPRKAAEDQQAASGAGGSVNVTLSDAARAAIRAQGDPSTTESIVSAARSAIDSLLADAGTTDALSDGAPTIDMSGLDRRSLFVVAANQGGGFTAGEQAVAAYTMANNFANALAGPVSASHVTGDYAAIYKAGLAYLDRAGPEEKATASWTQQHDALAQGQQAAASRPGVLPVGIPNDPVAAYVTALAGADPTTTNRDILKVAGDVRSALDAQYAGGPNTRGDVIDLSSFDDRALAAIALDKGDQFSSREVSAARAEIRDRASIGLSGYAPNGGSTRSSAIGSDLITRYASMSVEERQAQGWTPDLYEKLVQNQQLSQKLAGSLAGSTGNPYLGSADRPMSLLDFLA
jgi:hypothetical protein